MSTAAGGHPELRAALTSILAERAPKVDRDRAAACFDYADAAHGPQVRRSGEPYMAHPIEVVRVLLDLLETRIDTTVTCAALLHDVVEDTATSIAEVEAAFGSGVAAIVADCTDTGPGETLGNKRPWLVRKREYLARLRAVASRSALVIACDKLHNAAGLIADLERDGVATLARFNAPAPKQLWYMRGVAAALAGRVPDGLARLLAHHAERFAALTGATPWPDEQG